MKEQNLPYNELPYDLNSPMLPAKRRCAMDPNDLLAGYNFFKKHIPTTETYEQHVNVVNQIIEWLDGIERTNDINNRLKVIDNIKYFFLGRLKERHRFLDMANMITEELKDMATEHLSNFIDSEGNVIEEKQIGFGNYKKEHKIGF